MIFCVRCNLKITRIASSISAGRRRKGGKKTPRARMVNVRDIRIVLPQKKTMRQKIQLILPGLAPRFILAIVETVFKSDTERTREREREGRETLILKIHRGRKRKERKKDKN